MTFKTIFPVFLTALFLTLAAQLLSISDYLPVALSYFAIALLASTLTLLLVGKQTAGLRDATLPSKEKGQVKWFSPSKGFGFITRDNGEDIFVHFRSISGSGHRILREGQRVEFAVTEGDKGIQAEDVTSLS